MKGELIKLDVSGKVSSEMFGFQGNSCLKAAAEIARELERLGVVTEVESLRMKDTTKIMTETQAAKLKIERG